jgi:hypothetical protein
LSSAAISKLYQLSIAKGRDVGRPASASTVMSGCFTKSVPVNTNQTAAVRPIKNVPKAKKVSAPASFKNNLTYDDRFL